MKAAVLRTFPFRWPTTPLEVLDIANPVPKSGEALVRVTACGLCHTDILYLKEGLKPLKDPPLVLGHEISGFVESVGEETVGVEPGDRIVASYLIPCHRCLNCRLGRDNICFQPQILGSSRDGGEAEYVTVPAEALFKVPSGIDVESAAIVTDAVATSFHAVFRRAKIRPGETVVIFGAGALGLSIVQLAKLANAGKIIVVGRKLAKLKVAEELGADETISVLDYQKPSMELIRRTRGGADVVIEAAGDVNTMEQACRSTRRGGRVIIVGYGSQDFRAPSRRLMWYELSILGACNYKPADDLPVVLNLVLNGKLKIEKMITDRISLSEINRAYGMLERGESIRILIKP